MTDTTNAAKTDGPAAQGHTPGEWVASGTPNSKSWHVRCGSDASLIATVGNLGATSDHVPTARRWRAETPANARLIAASPDLFGTAREVDRLTLVILAAVSHADRGNLDAVSEALKAQRAAIAKATGAA
jgi:hypothetical protein